MCGIQLACNFNRLMQFSKVSRPGRARRNAVPGRRALWDLHGWQPSTQRRGAVRERHARSGSVTTCTPVQVIGDEICFKYTGGALKSQAALSSPRGPFHLSSAALEPVAGMRAARSVRHGHRD